MMIEERREKSLIFTLMTVMRPTSSWRPFGRLDFVLRAFGALRPCDPTQVTEKLLKIVPFDSSGFPVALFVAEI